MSEPELIPIDLIEAADREQPDYCHNCDGNYGRLYDGDTYVCAVCGDEWDRYPESPFDDILFDGDDWDDSPDACICPYCGEPMIDDIEANRQAWDDFVRLMRDSEYAYPITREHKFAILATDARLRAAEQRAVDAEAKAENWEADADRAWQRHLKTLYRLGDARRWSDLWKRMAKRDHRCYRRAEACANDAEEELAQAREELADTEAAVKLAVNAVVFLEARNIKLEKELAALRRVAEAGQNFLAQLHMGLPLNMATCDLPGYMDFAHALDVAGMAALDAAGEGEE